MADHRSAIFSVQAPGRYDQPGETCPLTFREIAGRDLVQISFWPETSRTVEGLIAKSLGTKIPVDCRTAATTGEMTVFRIAPDRLQICGPRSQGIGKTLAAQLADEQAAVTELGHSRTIIRISGPMARTLLMRGLPVDLDDERFAIGDFAQSAIHRMPVLAHRADADVYDVYAARGFAASLWDWLTKAAESFGYRVE